MRSTFTKASFTCTALLLGVMPTFADWRTDIGWNDLQTWATLNSKTLNNASSVFVGITEAEQAGDNKTVYSPDPANAQLSDVTIDDVYGETVSYSGHATNVASLFFGNFSSITPDVTNANSYGANRFLNQLVSFPSSWSEDVISHAYVGNFSSTDDSERFCRALDYTTAVAGVLHVSGANNGSSTNLRHIWSHAYNNISVGRTDGLHSAGTVQSGFHGAGRQKPEVVCPQGSTSSATGATSSVATFLRAQANSHASGNAVLPLTIKSCILAGATKSKFPSWDNTSTRPIDEVFGAGEISVLNSYRILQSAEAVANSTVPLYGWDHHNADSAEINYSFTVPNSASSASISANLSWNRTVTRERSRGSWIVSYDELSDLSLTLKDSLGNIIFTSDSAVDNLEHIWLPSLEPGNYTLSVNKANGPDTLYALAWRVDARTDVFPTSFTIAATTNDIAFDNLFPNYSYNLQRSSDLQTWNTVSTITSDASGTFSYSDPNSSLGEKVFYRLQYFTP